MGVYEDEFDSIEDAVEALKGAIEERDGKFVVGGELRKAFKEAGTNAFESKKYRERARRAEGERDEFKSKFEETSARLESVLATKPEETQAKLEEFARQKAELEKQVRDLPTLRERIAGYERAEETAKIRDALRDAASTLGIRPEATRDVERLAGLFSVDKLDGSIRDAQGDDVATVLAAELKASPHWLPTSQGGGSTGGTSAPRSAAEKAEEDYRKAKEAGDVEGMLRARFGFSAR